MGVWSSSERIFIWLSSLHLPIQQHRGPHSFSVITLSSPPTRCSKCCTVVSLHLPDKNPAFWATTYGLSYSSSEPSSKSVEHWSGSHAVHKIMFNLRTVRISHRSSTLRRLPFICYTDLRIRYVCTTLGCSTRNAMFWGLHSQQAISENK